MLPNEDLFSWVDGFMLGDGHIAHYSRNAYAYIGSKYKEWAEYAMTGLWPFDMTGPSFHRIWNKRLNKEYTSWSIRTLSHPFFTEQRIRWYPDNIKRIPPDIRANSISLLLWYLGDGSLDGNSVSIAAYDFSEAENAFLSDRFFEELGLRFSLHMSKGRKSKLYLPAAQTDKFFDIIGRVDPTGCYGYKFKTTRANRALSLNVFCREVSVPHSWAVIHVKSGRVESEKNGSYYYLTDRGKEQLREIIAKEYRPRGKENLSTLTQEQVLKKLRIHPRRVAGLISAAGIAPRRTPGGQYRFTREEVDKMHLFSRIRKTKKKIQ